MVKKPTYEELEQRIKALERYRAPDSFPNPLRMMRS